MPIYDACDFIVVRLAEGGHYVNLLKLQKILYYFQAWSLAFGRGRLFDEDFQAWVHGPVNRTIYDRFAGYKALYSPMRLDDVRPDFNVDMIDQEARALMEAVLEHYGHLSGDQLEEMTHNEEPWMEARQGVQANQRSENVISDQTMQRYYAARIQ